MPKNEYGRVISLDEAKDQKDLRDVLKKEVAKSGTLNLNNVQTGFRNEAKSLLLDSVSVNGFVFERKFIQRFFEFPYWADYIVVYESCAVKEEGNIKVGNPVVSVLPVRYKGIEDNQDVFEIIEVNRDEDASEHPGVPIIESPGIRKNILRVEKTINNR